MDGTSLFQLIFNTILVAQAETPEGTISGSTGSENWASYGVAALYVLGIFVVPFVLSHFITRAVRMPTLSGKLGLMFAAIIGGLLFCYQSNFVPKLGVDMKGGTTLIYDIEKGDNGQRINASALAKSLGDRINPSGTKEISIRPLGETQIEIIVPATDELELQRLKKRLTQAGQLEFRIVANTRDHQDIIQLARDQASGEAPRADVVDNAGKTIGRWYRVGRDTEKVGGVYPFETPIYSDIVRNSVTGQIIDFPQLDFDKPHAAEKWLESQGVRDVDVLIALQRAGTPYAVVSGDDLANAANEMDKVGRPIVGFQLTTSGAGRMLSLTAENQPDGAFKRRLAIIMDKTLLSAPTLNEPISNSGQISGTFTKEEVDFLVNILRSGRLPATLSEEPVSENRVGAGLGTASIQKGKTASLWSIVVTFATILLYYRFSGIVASIALIINGLLMLAIMIAISQPLTLPGLAGLVLTIGMSVDANVLIFERIREERAKGSTPRLAIRNGFDRALTTIVDSNLTTLIAAIVLYWIGTDQVRGFAVALIIGIMTSMFTATFCSRIMFEIAEKLKIVNLSMSDGVLFLKKLFFGDRDVPFMSFRTACFVFSGVLLVGGMIAVINRGKDILNIDFTGGTSVTFRLQEPVEPDALRDVTRDILTQKGTEPVVESTLVRVESIPMNTVYTLVTSIQDKDDLSKKLFEGFSANNSANLVTYRLKVTKPGSSEATSFLPTQHKLARFVGLQDENSPKPAEGDSAAVASGETPGPADQSNAATTTTSDVSAPSSTSTAAASADQSAATPSNAAEATSDADIAQAVPSAATTEFILEFRASNEDNPDIPASEKVAKIDGATLRDTLLNAAKEAGVTLNEALVEISPEPRPADWNPEDIGGYTTWRIGLPVDDASAATIVEKVEAAIQKQPLWLSLNQIGSRVAGEMQERAIAAILVSLIFIVAYIWFRFQRISYGLAAVVALLHDVLITLGAVALCHWLAKPLGFLLIEDFKIGLTEVAAFLTIIGYSLNDTIVVFDRIREIRGRSPKLTTKMIDDSVNQTLSRTLLTSGTTILTVLLLYIFGGEGIHTFSFALLFGILIGTYSSIFIAAPVLLWLSEWEESRQQRRPTV